MYKRPNWSRLPSRKRQSDTIANSLTRNNTLIKSLSNTQINSEGFFFYPKWFDFGIFLRTCESKLRGFSGGGFTNQFVGINAGLADKPGGPARPMVNV